MLSAYDQLDGTLDDLQIVWQSLSGKLRKYVPIAQMRLMALRRHTMPSTLNFLIED